MDCAQREKERLKYFRISLEIYNEMDGKYIRSAGEHSQRTTARPELSDVINLMLDPRKNETPSGALCVLHFIEKHYQKTVTYDIFKCCGRPVGKKVREKNVQSHLRRCCCGRVDVDFL